MEKDTNPKDALGTAKWRQFMTVPRQVLWEVGVAMLEGALKYGRHNYRASGVRASVYLDAAYGHLDQFCEGEDLDKDSGLSHVTKAITSLVVLRDAMMNDFWTDDRPPKIKDLDELREFLQTKVQENFERHADKSPHHYTQVENGAPYRLGGEEQPVPIELQVSATETRALDSKVMPITQMQLDESDFVQLCEATDLYSEGLIFQVKSFDGPRVFLTIDGKNAGYWTTRQFKRVFPDDWGADDTAIDDEEILAMAAHTPAVQAVPATGVTVEEAVEGIKHIAKSVGRNEPDFSKYAELLADTTWAPSRPVAELLDDDPVNLIPFHKGVGDEYDTAIIVEGLTSGAMDRLVNHESEQCGWIGTPVNSDGDIADRDVYDMLLRRVLIRLRMRNGLWHTVEGISGERRRFSRLRNAEWFIAYPGARVSPDVMPRSFA